MGYTAVCIYCTALMGWDLSFLETLDLTLLVYILTLLVWIYTQVT